MYVCVYVYVHGRKGVVFLVSGINPSFFFISSVLVSSLSITNYFQEIFDVVGRGQEMHCFVVAVVAVLCKGSAAQRGGITRRGMQSYSVGGNFHMISFSAAGAVVEGSARMLIMSANDTSEVLETNQQTNPQKA
jgi:hypothetical protein